MNPIITSQRLDLRPIRVDDSDRLCAILADPEVMKYSTVGPLTALRVEKWMAEIMREQADVGYSWNAVVHRADGILIGLCGLHGVIVDDRHYVEIGYRLARAYWGAGIATEACRATLNHAFTVLGQTEIVAFIDPVNTASVRVAIKVGMQPVGPVTRNNFTYELFRCVRDEWLEHAIAR